MAVERREQRRPSRGGVAVAPDRRKVRGELGRAPGEHQPVDAAEEPQRHGLLVARVELAGEESTARSAGEDVVGHVLEEVGVER